MTALAAGESHGAPCPAQNHTHLQPCDAFPPAQLACKSIGGASRQRVGPAGSECRISGGGVWSYSSCRHSHAQIPRHYARTHAPTHPLIHPPARPPPTPPHIYSPPMHPHPHLYSPPTHQGVPTHTRSPPTYAQRAGVGVEERDPGAQREGLGAVVQRLEERPHEGVKAPAADEEVGGRDERVAVLQRQHVAAGSKHGGGRRRKGREGKSTSAAWRGWQAL